MPLPAKRAQPWPALGSQRQDVPVGHAVRFTTEGENAEVSMALQDTGQCRAEDVEVVPVPSRCRPA